MKYRMTNTKLKPVSVTIFDSIRFNDTAKPVRSIIYNHVDRWELVNGPDAAKIESESDGSCVDPAHEYLVLHFLNGDTATFRYNFTWLQLLDNRKDFYNA